MCIMTQVTDPNSPVAQQSVAGDLSSEKVYTVGTLTYTRRGLVMVFFWILWGDFIFTLMETVVPIVLPLQLEKFGASNFLMGILMVTIPSMLNFVITPWVSFKSDRYRSRWGRRIPFLLFPAPLVALFLVLLGYSEPIGAFIHQTAFAQSSVGQVTVVLSIFAFFATAFRFFDMFANSVYWYLFNDVVPAQFLGRFMSLIRLVGALAGVTFNFFLMKYTGTHGSEMLIGAGIIYLVGYSLMCLKVKEGQYPPPPENVDGRKGSLSSMKTFLLECFTHRFYWFNFLASTFFGMATCIGFVSVLYWKSLGITLEQMGYMGGIAGIIGLALTYPCGVFSDRRHPLRSVLIGLGGMILVNPIMMIFIFHDVGADWAYRIIFAVRLLNLPLLSLYGVAVSTLTMRIYPMERYGQYCSAEAMVRALGVILGGVLAGVFMDVTKRMSGEGDFYYRFSPLWSQLFYMLSWVFIFIVYRYWKNYGGDDAYVPPAPAAANPRRGFEVNKEH